MREKLLFDFGWKFHDGDVDVKMPVTKMPMYIHAKTESAKWGPATYNYDDNSDIMYIDKDCTTEYWKTVDLPHDYIIYQKPEEHNNNALGYFDYHNAWYRNSFMLPKEDENKRITIYFEGVATFAEVYVNGCLMKRNFCGYNSFEVDITDIAKFGEKNVVAVYVQSGEHEGWWYEGAGIYRHVWLVKTEKISVDLYGIYVHPEKCGEIWNIPVEITLRNDTMTPATVKVKTLIKDNCGNVLTSAETEADIDFKSKNTLNQEMNASNPVLWNIDNPYIYNAEVIIEKEGVKLDNYETYFGFRTIEFNAEKGFFLNGENVKIKGVCCHQDYGLTGKAVADNVQEYKVRLLKEMGANGYRTSHYPHTEATMEALDKNGFLVMAETRWYGSSDETLNQLETMIKRDRNRPGIIMWSVGNEEPKHEQDDGRRIMETMKAAAFKLDKTRPVMTAVDRPAGSTVFELSDIIGINYNLAAYKEVREKYPDKLFVSSECCATGTTRGWYTDTNPQKGYVNAYDSDPQTFACSREKTWRFFMSHEWICGGYQWTGIEYRGETYWPRICSQSGAIDLFLQKKDAFYQNKSHWTNEPMVHILPHWNHEGREGEILPVWVYTNCEEVELFRDGTSCGRQKIEKYGHGEWNLEYYKGELKAVGYNNNAKAAEEIIKTTKKAVKLKMRLENENIRANNEDTAIITCYCEDEEGNPVPDAEAYIDFECNSLGKIIGTGSDVCDHDPVTAPSRRMRAGLCSVAVKTGTEKGVLKLYARAGGLIPARLEIELKDEKRRNYVK